MYTKGLGTTSGGLGRVVGGPGMVLVGVGGGLWIGRAGGR